MCFRWLIKRAGGWTTEIDNIKIGALKMERLKGLISCFLKSVLFIF